MQSLLQHLIVGNVFAFMLIFMRLGTALMIMPGVGDTFVSPQLRLTFALAFSFVLTPFLSHNLPAPPAQAGEMVALIVTEGFIGGLIGMVMRILVSALDTAGMVTSMQAGYSNAMVFNPMTASQGSLIGSLYTLTGVTLLFVTDMHHYMLATVVDSYRMFPAGAHLLDAESALEVIRRAVSTAFRIGVELATPFLIVGTLVQLGFGLLGRLMPQVQVYFVAMPLQLLLSLVMLTMVLSGTVLYWLNAFPDAVNGAFSP